MNIKAHIHMLLEVRAAHPTPRLCLQMCSGWCDLRKGESQGREGPSFSLSWSQAGARLALREVLEQAWVEAWTQSLFNLFCPLFQGLRELQGLQNFPETPHH